MNDHTHDLDSERAALATVLSCKDHTAAWQELIDTIGTPLAFWDRNHQIVAVAAQALAAEGAVLDPIAVGQWLTAHSFGELVDALRDLQGDQGRRPKQSPEAPAYEDSALAAIGGHAALADLAGTFAPRAGLAKTARVIAAHYRQRKALEATTALIDALRAPSGATKAPELIDAAIERLTTAASPDRGVTSLVDGMADRLARHDEIRDRPEAATCALWGIRSLDEAVPLDPGTLTTLAARPGAGKTSLLLHALEATARRYGPGSVAFVSREMGVSEIASVVLARHLRLPRRLIDRGGLSQGQRDQAESVRKEAESWNLWVRDGLKCTAEEACAWAQARHRATGGRLALLAIDHVGILSRDHAKQMEYDHVSRATGALKSLARTLRIPVLELCQMSRDDKRAARGKDQSLLPDPEPHLSDLRGSGTIEQDSDQVIFLYRPTRERLSNGAEQVSYKCAKVRSGPQARGILEWRPAEGQRFADSLPPAHEDKPTRHERLHGGDPIPEADPVF